MHAAAQQGGGSGMASVAGLDDPGMKKLIAEASKAVGGGKEAYIANYLFPGGRTLSGDIDVLDWICANAAARAHDKAFAIPAPDAELDLPYLEAPVRLYKRPLLDDFLEEASKLCDLVVFTSAAESYARAIAASSPDACRRDAAERLGSAPPPKPRL